MISVAEALHHVKTKTPILQMEERALGDSIHYVLAEDVFSCIDMPPFPQSAMDGYALNYHEKITTYQLIGVVKAGSSELYSLEPGEAVRIFTGAPVPETANTVIQQEWVKEEGGSLEFIQEIKVGLNIRPQGEQTKKDTLGLKKGSLLNPAAIGFLAAIGTTKVNVYGKPKIAIVGTGDELIEPGHALAYGQIYESNVQMLESACHANLFTQTSSFKLPDDFEATKNALESILLEHDIVFVTGGISVGDYDFVGKAFTALGINEHFYKVKQKPGKPLFFGSQGNKIIFGLPGNPASTLTCFYIYGLPCLKQLAGGTFSGLPQFKAPLKNGYIKKGTRAEFLKAHFCNNQVEILSNQSSAMLNSYAEANALVYIPEEKERVDKDEWINLFLIG